MERPERGKLVCAWPVYKGGSVRLSTVVQALPQQVPPLRIKAVKHEVEIQLNRSMRQHRARRGMQRCLHHPVRAQSYRKHHDF